MTKTNSLKTKIYQNEEISLRKELLKMIALELASKSKRWKYLFDLASLEDVEDWQMVSFTYEYEAGIHLSQPSFVLARVAKLVATTEEWQIDETLTTKKDLVQWNRHAILAKIEVEKQKGLNVDLENIERGLKALQIINTLYPEYLLE